MPHNGFIYEAKMDMMENSGHCYSMGLLRDYEVCAEVRCKLYSKCMITFCIFHRAV